VDHATLIIGLRHESNDPQIQLVSSFCWGDSSVQASAKFIRWLDGGGRGVAITGASGWIGRAMAHVALETMAGRPGARLRLFGSRARTIDVAGQPMALESLTDLPPLGDGEWLVLHLAVAGPDRVADPDALRALNDAMLADAFALAQTGQVRRFVCASSGAVYQAGQGSPQKQAYSDLKRDHEQIARAWSAKTSVPLLMPRIFNVGGPYMTNPDAYALGSFIRQAEAGGAIRIEARRPVIRSYVHGLELARVVFELAFDEGAPLAFDTAGPEWVEMADLARAVGRVLAIPTLQIVREALETGEEDRYLGDGGVYQATLAGLGAAPIGLDDIIRDTAAWLRA
jgi:nucleoside-diphosphate-sugar epimerase